jgi:hypothetical protein
MDKLVGGSLRVVVAVPLGGFRKTLALSFL